MPRMKGWWKAECKVTDWESRKTGKYDIESPKQMPAQSRERKQAQSPEQIPQSPKMKQAQSLERMPAQSPERKQAQSPEWMRANRPESRQTLNMEKPVHSYDKTDNLVQKEKLQRKHEKLHSSDLIMNSSVNSPDSFSLYTAIPLESASNSWNYLNRIEFGSFHQNDARFPEQSRRYQCTCNASCMLAYSISLDVEKSSVLDKVLCEGYTLYQSVISKLKADGKFIHRLLSLDEIPDDFKLDIGKFTFQKLPIVCDVLVDTRDRGLPTLNSALQSAFFLYRQVCYILVAYVLQYLKRMDHTHFLILIPMEKMDSHQVMVLPVR